MLVNQKAIKDYCKKRGRRVGADFMEQLNRYLSIKLSQACKIHNGGKITLDESVANYVGLSEFKKE